MTPDEYIAKAIRTAPENYPYFTSDKLDPDIVHAWLGVTTECGESGDVVKKALIYGKEPDLVNLDEEMGDKLWYLALYCHRRQITFEYLFEQNIAKLQARFPDKFTEADALNRDVVAERKVLDSYAKNDGANFGTILTRQYIKLNQEIPTKGVRVYYPVSDQTFTFTGVTWEEVKDE